MKVRTKTIVIVSLVVAVIICTPYLMFAATRPPHPKHMPPLRTTCSMFQTQAQAQQAYRDGAYWLDGDGDSRACEALP